MKTRLLTIALAFASVAFAQQATKAEFKMGKELPNGKVDASKVNTMKTAVINSNWFSYVNGYENFYGQQTAELNANNLFPDSTVLVNYGASGYSGPWIHSVAVVMDLESDVFVDTDPNNNFYPGVDYTIDSVVTTGIYTRVSGSSIVDTLVINIFEGGGTNVSSQGGFLDPVASNLGTDTVWFVNFDWDFPTTSTPGASKTIKVLMDDNFFTDTTASGLHQVDAAVNLAITASSSHYSSVVGVTFEFHPGYSWTANIDTLGVNVNSWRFLSWKLNGAGNFMYYDKGDWNSSQILPVDVRYDNAGGWNNSFIPSMAYMGGATGTYSYEAHEMNLRITQDANISVGEDTKIDFSVYPNPSNGEFNVRFGNVDNGTYTVRLLNIIGQEVYNNTVDATANQVESLNFNSLDKGVYLLSISGNGMNTVQRVVLK